jgi:predicted RNA binding protein YcfA (HicA-like mRNA interferase family)
LVKGFYLAVVKELQAMGFVHTTNAKGSHEKWVRGRETLIVPRHLYTRPLANALLKQAGSRKRV